MKYMIISLLLLGCSSRPEPKPIENKIAGDYTVSLLFTHDNCKVYRFVDGDYYRYFTNCSETMTTQSYRCGKNTCYFPDSNKTNHHGAE